MWSLAIACAKRRAQARCNRCNRCARLFVTVDGIYIYSRQDTYCKEPTARKTHALLLPLPRPTCLPPYLVVWFHRLWPPCPPSPLAGALLVLGSLYFVPPVSGEAKAEGESGPQDGENRHRLPGTRAWQDVNSELNPDQCVCV